MTSCSSKSVAVVGGGPVGALAALYFAKHFSKVTLYELRPDPRIPSNRAGLPNKSINLALSDRGILGIRGVSHELAEEVVATTIPMRGRCLHDRDGNQVTQFYDVYGRHNNSMDRNWLNERLLTEAERTANVQLAFEHKLQKCDVNKGTLTFLVQGREKNVNADIIIGADGVYSQVRTGLMRAVKMDFSQNYIDCMWCELEIPASDTPTEWGGFKMIPERLHIWPRGNFMLIALPNNDKTFTCTLFMPESMISLLKTPQDLIGFFEREFADSIPLIGQDKLISDFFANPKSTLVSIKCTPYHYKDKALIIGDAAHSQVPFYGQGLNTGFEDLTLLFSLFPPSGEFDLSNIFNQYSTIRTPDAHAVCDLALHNYQEMASGVISMGYKMRKMAEDLLYRYVPWTGIVPLYTMVSFGGMRYSELRRKWVHQGRILRFSGWITALAILIAVGCAGRRVLKR